MIEFSAASEQDDGALRELMAIPMPGDLSLSLRREPSFLESCARCGPPRETIVAKTKGEAVAVCSFFKWSYRLENESKEIALVADFRAKAKAAHRSITGLGWGALRDRLEGTPALVSLVDDNPISLRLFSKNRKGWPTLHKATRLITYLYPVTALMKSRSLGAFRPCGSDLVEYWDKSKDMPLSPLVRESDLGSALPPLDSFLALSDGTGLSACGALWNQGSYRQTVVHSYGGFYQKIRTLLPKPGYRIRTAFASFFRAEDAYSASQLARALAAKAWEQGVSYLVWGQGEKSTNPFPRHWPRFSYPSSLYQLLWPGDEPLPWVAKNSFEVAWL